MDCLLLASKGNGFKVFLIIVGIFSAIFILCMVYGKIVENTKMDDDSKGCGWPIFLLAVALIIGGLMNMKSCGCKGTHGGGYDSDEEYWENTPRHTYIQQSTAKFC